MSKSVCEPIESMKVYLDKRVGKKLRICMNIHFPKAVAHSMNQFFKKTYETWPKIRFFRGFSQYIGAKSGFWPFFESKKFFDEIFSMGSKSSKTCLRTSGDIVGCLEIILVCLGVPKMRV